MGDGGMGAVVGRRIGSHATGADGSTFGMVLVWSECADGSWGAISGDCSVFPVGERMIGCRKVGSRIPVNRIAGEPVSDNRLSENRN